MGLSVKNVVKESKIWPIVFHSLPFLDLATTILFSNEIVDKTEDKNGECVFICLDKNTNKTFSCKPEGSHELRVQYLEDDNIGKFLTVRFFELTDEGIPRFPVGVYVRID